VYPKLDNFYYKELAAGKEVVLHSALKTKAMKEIVDKFAQDKKAYHAAFGKAFLKLSNLGFESDQLSSVENLLEDHPYRKFMFVHY
jgi:hypothetical protein